jgi:TfoX/Sxy family transcriptional regulator of competence genes
MDAGIHFISIVESLLSDSRISTAKMFGSQGLKVGTKVFAMLVKGQLVVKLPQERVAALIACGAGESFDPGHGRRMKEWVVLSRAEDNWTQLVEEARDFVATDC